MSKIDNRCAHSEAINQHIREQDRIEEMEEKEIEVMRAYMEDKLITLAANFNDFIKDCHLNKEQFKDILLEDLKELL